MGRARKKQPIPVPQGFFDILPKDQKYIHFVLKKTVSLLEDYGFERMDPTLVESSELAIRAAGDNGEEVAKKLIGLKGGEGNALRSDLLLSMARAYVLYGLYTKPQPVKMFSIGITAKNTGNIEERSELMLAIQTIGDETEVADSELLFIAHRFLDAMGLGDAIAHVNTVGDNQCRPGFIRALKDYYKTNQKKICVQCRGVAKENIMDLLSCIETSCRESLKDAPQILDFLDADCKAHFKRVLEFLDLAKVPYFMNTNLVSSSNYATRTIFSFVAEDIADLPGVPTVAPLVFGGRSDKLIEALGGPKTPTAGMTVNLSRVISMLKSKDTKVPNIAQKPKVFLAQLGDAAKRKSILLFEEIRSSGIHIRSSFSRDSVKSQLRIAYRLGVKITIILGQKEAIEHTVILRDMEAGTQESIPQEKLIDELKKRLKRHS